MINVEIIKRLFPFLNLLVIGLTVTKLILFYRYFGISIVQYIDISEAFILLFEDVLFYVATFLLTFIFTLLLVGHPIASIGSESTEKIASEQNLPKRIWLIFMWVLPIIALIMLSIYNGRPNIPLIIAVFVILIVFQTRFVLKTYYNSDLAATYTLIIGLIITTIVFEYNELKKQVMEIISGKYTGTTLHIKDKESMVTDSTLIYVGKAKDYYFLYDKKKENAVIISSGEVDRVDLKNNYRWFMEYPN